MKETLLSTEQRGASVEFSEESTWKAPQVQGLQKGHEPHNRTPLTIVKYAAIVVFFLLFLISENLGDVLFNKM